MFCAHRIGNISSGLSTSNIIHHFWPARISKTKGNNIQDLYASVVACVHLLNVISRGRNINMATSINGRLLQPRHGRISEDYWSLGNQRRSSTYNISQVMYASDMTSVHVESDVSQWNASSTKSSRHKSCRLGVDFFIFTLANVRQRQQRNLNFGQVTLSIGKKHHHRIARLRHGVYTLAKQN